MEWISDPQGWIALITLVVLEIVLGIDNIIFISIITGKLPKESQNKGRIAGLSLAMISRIALLFSLSMIMKLTTPFFSIFGADISGRDIILITGGLFLIAKSTHEIHDKLEGSDKEESVKKVYPSFVSVIIQVILLDIVFSLDSVITAIGMVNELAIMIAAVVIAVGFMLVFSGIVSRFVLDHPTVKMLALSFLLLIGVSLIAEGFGQHIPKGYIYFSMAFSVFVEMLNMKVRSRRRTAPPVKLRGVLAEKGKNS